MAFGKTAGCLIAAGALWASAAQFTVKHDHVNGSCQGILTVDESGVAYAGAKGHAWRWALADIQQLTLDPHRIVVVSYRDSVLRFGADRQYEFEGDVPAAALYAMLRDRMDHRLVTAYAEPAGALEWSAPVKRLGAIRGSQGMLAFGADAAVYSTDAAGQSRTWRYTDIANISSSGPFQLTITSWERARSHYGDRKAFNFQLKEPLSEARYNQLWLEIERKNGRLP